MVTPEWVRLGGFPDTCSPGPSAFAEHGKVSAEQMLCGDAVFGPIVKLFKINYLNSQEVSLITPAHHNGAMRLSF